MLFLVSLPNRPDLVISPLRLLLAVSIICGCSIAASLLIGYLRWKLPALLPQTARSETQMLDSESQSRDVADFATGTRRPA